MSQSSYFVPLTLALYKRAFCSAFFLVVAAYLLRPYPVHGQGAHPAAVLQSIENERVLKDRSPDPEVVEVELLAAPAQLSLVQGKSTDVFAYNGRVPGPLLEVSEGDSVVIHFRNELPEETTVHLHGLHLPFVSDGSPFHPVAPGGTYTYAFRAQPGSAGTYWYHPHPHHRTAYQVGKGLYGAIIVRDPNDPLPESLTERLIILSDNRFGPDGSVEFAEPGTRQAEVDRVNGREGDVLFVSGKIHPTIPIRSGEIQRWRIVNASGARIYRLALEDHTFLHVGSDGGLFEHPIETDEILLANGERAEVLVRGTGDPGSASTLRTLPYDRYMARTRPDDWDEPSDVLDRSGEPESQPMWKDTVNLPSFERARFVVRFEDYPGKWMFHCHILTHEDQGMMGVLEVK